MSDLKTEILKAIGVYGNATHLAHDASAENRFERTEDMKKAWQAITALLDALPQYRDVPNKPGLWVQVDPDGGHESCYIEMRDGRPFDAEYDQPADTDEGWRWYGPIPADPQGVKG